MVHVLDKTVLGAAVKGHLSLRLAPFNCVLGERKATLLRVAGSVLLCVVHVLVEVVDKFLESEKKQQCKPKQLLQIGSLLPRVQSSLNEHCKNSRKRSSDIIYLKEAQAESIFLWFKRRKV